MSAPNTRRRSLLAGLFAAPALAAVPAVALASTASRPAPAEAPELLSIGERLPDIVARIHAARSRFDEAIAAYERLKPAIPPEIIAPDDEGRRLVEVAKHLRNRPIEHQGDDRRIFLDIYSWRELKAHIILYDISRHTKEGRRLSRIVRLAKKYERDREAAISASGYHEAFGVLLEVCIELQDDFAKAALATKPLSMRGIGICAAIVAAGNGPGNYDGRAVGYCDALGLHMAESFIALTADGRAHGNAP